MASQPASMTTLPQIDDLPYMKAKKEPKKPDWSEAETAIRWQNKESRMCRRDLSRLSALARTCAAVGLALVMLAGVGCSKTAEQWVEEGSEHAVQGRLGPALAAYTKATKLKPDHAPAWAGRGLMLHAIERYDKAVVALRKATELNPDYTHAYAAAIVSKGVSLLGQKRPDDALASFESALELKPDYARAWYNMGLALGVQHQFEEALVSLDKAIELDPVDTLAWNARVFLLKELGRHTDARKAANKAAELRIRE